MSIQSLILNKDLVDCASQWILLQPMSFVVDLSNHELTCLY